MLPPRSRSVEERSSPRHKIESHQCASVPAYLPNTEQCEQREAKEPCQIPQPLPIPALISEKRDSPVEATPRVSIASIQQTEGFSQSQRPQIPPLIPTEILLRTENPTALADSTTPPSNQEERSASVTDINDGGDGHRTCSNPVVAGVDSLVVQSVPIPTPSTIGNITTTASDTSNNLEDYSNRSIKSEPGITSDPTCSMWGTSNYQVSNLDSTELANVQQYLQYSYTNRFDQPTQQTYENGRCSSQEAVTTTNPEDPMLSRDVVADMDDINNPFFPVPNYPNMFINQQTGYPVVPYGDTSQKQSQGSHSALPPYYDTAKKACDANTKSIDEAHVTTCRPKMEHDTDGVNMQTKKVIVPAGEKHGA